MGRPRIAITIGRKYGKWTVLSEGSPSKWNHPRWECRCECGKVALLYGSALNCATTAGCKSCGKIKHGATVSRIMSPEYKIWKGMIQRCHNPKNKGFVIYGALGISVCAEWRGEGGFQAFLIAVGEKPSPLHEIDRIDPYGNYQPGNVRWATRKENARNHRSHRLLTIDGHTKKLCEWAELVGLRSSTITNRLKRGLDAKTAVFKTSSVTVEG